MQTVKFPANLITIGEMSFLSCKALEQVIFPQKIETIGMSAFVNCELISKISIPSSIKELKRTAFGNCTNTQEIYSYAQNPPTCGDNVFMNIDTENCKLYVPANTTDIYKANSTFEPFINIIEMGETLQLDENGINSGKLYRNENKTLNVELKRTFKAGEWSSICLPFSLGNSQMKQYFGEDVVLKELDRFGSVENGEPEMSLVMKDAESIAAGNPYIIKTSVDTDVLLFENITIEKSLTNQVVPEGKLYCVFAGTFNLTDMLSSGNYLVNPDGTLTIAPTYSEELQEFNVPGFSAYFMMPDEWFEKEVTLILDKIETSINTIKTTESNKYFNLQGHEMGTDSRKLPKGIYINNGKKIVIK